MAHGLCRLLAALPREKLMLSPPCSWAGLWPAVTACLCAWGIKPLHFVIVHGKHAVLLFNTDVCWRWEKIFKDWSSFVPHCLIREEEMVLLPGLFSTGSRYAFCAEPDWVAAKPKPLRPGSSKLETPRNVLTSSSLWWGRLRFQRVQGELWQWPVPSQLPAEFCSYSNHSCDFSLFLLKSPFFLSA